MVVIIFTYLPISAQGGPSAQTAAFLKMCSLDGEGGKRFVGLGGHSPSQSLLLKAPNK